MTLSTMFTVRSARNLVRGPASAGVVNLFLRWLFRGRALDRRVQPAVHVGVAQHGLDVAAGLRERDGFDEFGGLTEFAPGEPGARAGEAGVIRRQRDFGLAAQRC